MKTKLAMKTAALILVLFSIWSKDAGAITRISASSGNWNDGGTWNPTGTPACGDSIVIQSGHTIHISNQQNYSNCSSALRIIVYGRLMFNNGSKLSLPCGSYVIVYPGGVVEHDQGYSSSNLINICGIVEWDSDYNLFGLACLPGTHPICSLILPIELVSFGYNQVSDNLVSLYWETSTETNSDYFLIERSHDENSWHTIGQVDAAGNSSSGLHYFFQDLYPAIGTSYYRLTSFDWDGQFKIYQPISVNTEIQNETGIQVSPNPFIDQITVIIPENDSETIRFDLYDMTGRILSSDVYSGNNEKFCLNFNSPLLEGFYLLKAYSDKILIGSFTLFKN